MIDYDEAKEIVVSETFPNGKVQYSGDAGSFYIFKIVPENFPLNLKNPCIGNSFTAINKTDGKTWICYITDPRLKEVKKIE